PHGVPRSRTHGARPARQRSELDGHPTPTPDQQTADRRIPHGLRTQPARWPVHLTRRRRAADPPRTRRPGIDRNNRRHRLLDRVHKSLYREGEALDPYTTLVPDRGPRPGWRTLESADARREPTRRCPCGVRRGRRTAAIPGTLELRPTRPHQNDEHRGGELPNDEPGLRRYAA